MEPRHRRARRVRPHPCLFAARLVDQGDAVLFRCDYLVESAEGEPLEREIESGLAHEHAPRRVDGHFVPPDSSPGSSPYPLPVEVALVPMHQKTPRASVRDHQIDGDQRKVEEMLLEESL